MLAKKYRLRGNQVQQLIRKGKAQKYGLLGIKVLPNRLAYSRFACIISKKVAKKAVQRNRLRRIIFDQIKKEKTEGKDILIKLYKLPEDEQTLKKKIQEVFLEWLNI